MPDKRFPLEPTRQERVSLANELEKRFGFTVAQSRYLALNSFGYCNDTLNTIKQIEKSMKTLKKVLEDMQI